MCCDARNRAHRVPSLGLETALGVQHSTGAEHIHTVTYLKPDGGVVHERKGPDWEVAWLTGSTAGYPIFQTDAAGWHGDRNGDVIPHHSRRLHSPVTLEAGRGARERQRL